MASPLPQTRPANSEIIPNRLYFKIGDVAKICALESYVLRFWESQFPQLKPNKSGTGQRLYRRRDVELVLEIKRLVHGEGYTLAGARQALGQIQNGKRRDAQREPQSALPLRAAAGHPRGEGGASAGVVAAIERARAELREIAAQLAGPVADARVGQRARVTPMPRSSDTLFPF